MTYNLLYTARATRDLQSASDFIAQRAPETAESWFNDFVSALADLGRDAKVYGVAPENELCSVEVRQFIYSTKSRQANRALYTVRGNDVFILTIRRPGQDLVSPEELKQIVSELD